MDVDRSECEHCFQVDRMFHQPAGHMMDVDISEGQHFSQIGRLHLRAWIHRNSNAIFLTIAATSVGFGVAWAALDFVSDCNFLLYDDMAVTQGWLFEHLSGVGFKLGRLYLLEA